MRGRGIAVVFITFAIIFGHGRRFFGRSGHKGTVGDGFAPGFLRPLFGDLLQECFFHVFRLRALEAVAEEVP